VSQRADGVSLHGLEEKCTPSAEVFPVALRAAVARAILHLAPANPEHLGSERKDFIIRVLAEMPLAAAELTDVEGILRRIDGINGEQDLDSE